MRIVARLRDMIYILDENGRVHLLAEGWPDNVIEYPDLEARSLRRHAGFLRQHGGECNEQRADELDMAASAMEDVAKELAEKNLRRKPDKAWKRRA